MHPVSCTNTDHDNTDFVIMAWSKIQKLEYFENGTYIKKFLKKKKNYSSVYCMTHFEKLLFFSEGSL